jgi:MSHA biogenesis protein MshP
MISLPPLPNAARALRRKAHGFTMVSAIFLLVVLTMLGAAMLNFATSQHLGSQLDVQGTRAYQAARAGIEWGLYQQLRQGNCGSSSFAMPAGNTLSTFTVSVSCSSKTYGSGSAVNGVQLATGMSVSIYQITATACNQPSGGKCPGIPSGPDYVERQLQVTFRQ